ncbi:hypothetical protein BGZ73_008167 [Actinomortierella ambigua]|nr:hypothetical protein BGZ73_008167 [Actinomortierella ambigua]
MHRREDPSIASEQPVEDSVRRVEFTLVTLGANDRPAGEDSNEYWSRLRRRVLEPLTSSSGNPVASSGSHPRPRFDNIVFVQESLTCADDILEMIYQSHLQDTDMTCGMTWVASQNKESPELTLKTGQTPRDILGVPLAVPLKSMSADKDTLSTFQMRHPFQASCCDWRQGAVVRAEILMQQPSKTGGSTCEGRDNIDLEFCDQIALWRQAQASAQHVPQTDAGSGRSIEKHVNALDSGDEEKVTRIVIVPQAVWVPREQEYEMLETLDAEGLWSKTDQEHRDEIETRLIRASHQRTYGYRKSAAHYEYVARPAAEPVNEEGEAEEQQQLSEQQKENSMLPPIQAVESRLVRSKVAFGAQDIEQGNAIKAKKEQIVTWRASRLCPNK